MKNLDLIEIGRETEENIEKYMQFVKKFNVLDEELNQATDLKVKTEKKKSLIDMILKGRKFSNHYPLQLNKLSPKKSMLETVDEEKLAT